MFDKAGLALHDQEREWTLRVGQKIKSIAVLKGMSMLDLSSKSGVPYVSLCKYISNGQRLSLWNFTRLCTALEMSPQSVLEWSL